MAGVTINKVSGTPRKKGSGRTRGAFSYACVKASDLLQFLQGLPNPEQTLIPVARTFAEPLFPSAIAKSAKAITTLTVGLTPDTAPEVREIDLNDAE